MSKIYLPSFNNSNCVVVLDKDTIRVFDNTPTINNEVSFTDYFINSHYLQKEDKITFTGDDIIPTCLNQNDITTDFYYRNDIADILVVFFIILIICIYFPIKILARMFGRWLKI